MTTDAPGDPVPSDPAAPDRPKRGQLRIDHPMCVCGDMRDQHDENGQCRAPWRDGICPCDEFDEGDDDA